MNAIEGYLKRLEIYIKNDTDTVDWKRLLLVIFYIWVASAILITVGFRSMDKAGQFGDMFGAINALFSGLALSGVVIAILLQRRDLELQRDELRLTREEMENQREELRGQKEQLEGQKEILNKQCETATIQRFENSFYQMLKTHNDLIAMMYDYTDEKYEGT